MIESHHGSCLCGGVQFEIEGGLRAPDACHCVECRKSTGHFLVSVDIPRTALRFRSDTSLRWYNSSEKVRRGFCGTCGATLFWDPRDTEKNDWLAVALGAFDTDPGVMIREHIFVAEKGSYYAVPETEPQYATIPTRPDNDD